MTWEEKNSKFNNIKRSSTLSISDSAHNTKVQFEVDHWQRRKIDVRKSKKKKKRKEPVVKRKKRIGEDEMNTIAEHERRSTKRCIVQGGSRDDYGHSWRRSLAKIWKIGEEIYQSRVSDAHTPASSHVLSVELWMVKGRNPGWSDIQVTVTSYWLLGMLISVKRKSSITNWSSSISEAF